jgi:hypothetical protein
VPADLDALIHEQDAALAADPAWLGSPAHLDLLRSVVTDFRGLADVTILWVAVGEPAYWEASTRTMAIERPTATPLVPLQTLARLTLMNVVHESLHATYSTDD